MIAHPSARHAFVCCVPDRPSIDSFKTAQFEDISTIKDWISVGRPLIARMRRPEDPTDCIPLGLPLPLARGKRRIALTVPPSLLKSVEPPPELRSTLAVLPSDWQERITRICLRLAPNARAVRVVGSLAWQYLTREVYLHPKSDIDVVVEIADTTKLEIVLGILQSSDLDPGPRIDGEITTPHGDAVPWRELLGSSRDILVKHLDGPRITSREQWLATLGRASK
jgi:phosphoribosyl-dephospho-CoA transferase